VPRKVFDTSKTRIVTRAFAASRGVWHLGNALGEPPDIQRRSRHARAAGPGLLLHPFRRRARTRMDLHSLDMDMVHDDPEDGRWEAFVRRDPGADGRFVVAVETTCIYCRPTCPARRPLRKNVRFLPDAATAERQGYRACKRCKPQLAQLPSEALVAKVKSLLVADLEAPP